MEGFLTPKVKWAMEALIAIDNSYHYEYGYTTPLATMEEFNEIVGSAVSQHPGSEIYLLSFIDGEIEDGTLEGKILIANDSSDPDDYDHDPETERWAEIRVVQVRHRADSVLDTD